MQLKGNSKKLTDFRKETYWLMPIRRPRISHFRKFCFGDIFLSFGDISVSFGGIFLLFKNEQIMIEDRSYGKAELAMLYFPTATPG